MTGDKDTLNKMLTSLKIKLLQTEQDL